MDINKVEEIATVALFDLRLSEGELMVCEACMNYVMENCDAQNILWESGCESKEELYSFLRPVQELLINYTDKRFWSKHLTQRLL